MPIILLNTDSNSGVHNSSKYRTSIFLKPKCTYFIFIWWRKASTALHLLNESIHSFSERNYEPLGITKHQSITYAREANK